MATELAAGQSGGTLDIRIFEAKQLPIGVQWRSRDVRSAFWRLYMNDRTGASVRWRGGEHAIDAKHLHLLPPWMVFDCDNRRSLDHFYVHFDLLGVPAVVVRELFNQPIALPLDRTLRALAVDARDRVATPLPVAARLHVRSLIDIALGRAIDALPTERQRLVEMWVVGSSPVHRVVRFIDEHLGEPLPNERLARVAHLSRHHFIRVFQQAVGQTPARYVVERRVAVAAQRLSFTDQAIDDIAQQVGFADRFHLSRHFSRRMHVGPATYRRRFDPAAAAR
jgi:AraC-like DNA-binding protein